MTYTSCNYRCVFGGGMPCSLSFARCWTPCPTQTSRLLNSGLHSPVFGIIPSRRAPPDLSITVPYVYYQRGLLTFTFTCFLARSDLLYLLYLFFIDGAIIALKLKYPIIFIELVWVILPSNLRPRCFWYLLQSILVYYVLLYLSNSMFHLYQIFARYRDTVYFAAVFKSSDRCAHK